MELDNEKIFRKSLEFWNRYDDKIFTVQDLREEFNARELAILLCDEIFSREALSFLLYPPFFIVSSLIPNFEVNLFTLILNSLAPPLAFFKLEDIIIMDIFLNL